MMRGIAQFVPKLLISLLEDDSMTAHKLCIKSKIFFRIKN